MEGHYLVQSPYLEGLPMFQVRAHSGSVGSIGWAQLGLMKRSGTCNDTIFV